MNDETQGRDSHDAKAIARREALRKIGMYSAVTAPVLLGVLSAERAVAQTPIGDPIKGECTVSPPNCTFS